MSNPLPFDPQAIPWFDENLFVRFVDIFGSQTIDNRYIVYFIAACIGIYVVGWAIEYGQLHRFPYVGGYTDHTNEQMDVPKQSRIGGILVGLMYLAAEIVASTIGGYGFGTFTLSIVYSILSYSALIVIIAIPVGIYLYYMNRKSNEED